MQATLSENVLSHSREPCMKSNESKTATMFCKVCDEYLCDTCKNPHRVYKPGRHDIIRMHNRESVRVEQAMKNMKICQKQVETSPICLSSQSKPITLELLVSVDITQTGNDKYVPYPTGLDFLPDGRLVTVSSWNYSKCIIMDDRLQILGTPYKLNTFPHDVVCLSQGELAVTMRDKTVLLLSVSPDNVIRLTRTINTSTKVFSICCMTPTYMVVSTYDDPRPVRMITQAGVESDFDHVEFPKTYKLVESMCTYVPSKNMLVLTDRFANRVYMYDTVKGTSIAVADDNILRPLGACVGPCDTVLVCSWEKNAIIHLTVEGEILGTYPVDMRRPWALCMNKDGTRLAVSNSATGNNKIQLFKISPAIS